MSLLSVKNLTVRFGGLTAVNAVDLEVDDKEIFSVIGPNGAGKTTVFNVITGIYEPTAGTIELAGQDWPRPLTAKVVAIFALFGIVTAIAATLTAVNVDRLWRASIKRNFAVPSEFTYAAAWHNAVGYLRGDLAVERIRGGRFAVVTAVAYNRWPLRGRATRPSSGATTCRQSSPWRTLQRRCPTKWEVADRFTVRSESAGHV